MKTLLRLSFCLLFMSSTAKAAPTPTDSLKVRQVLITKRLDSLSTGLQRLSKTNDSLNNELRYYRAKDDFYVMAVDRQGSHFEWLLATVIGVAGFFSYTFFRREINKVRDELISHLDERQLEHNKFVSDFKQVKKDVFETLAVVLNNIQTVSEPNPLKISAGSLVNSLNGFLMSLEYCYELHKLSKDEESVKDEEGLIDQSFFNINLILDAIEKRTDEIKDEESFENFKKNRAVWAIKLLKNVSSINDTISVPAIEAISKINRLLNSDKKEK